MESITNLYDVIQKELFPKNALYYKCTVMSAKSHIVHKHHPLEDAKWNVWYKRHPLITVQKAVTYLLDKAIDNFDTAYGG